MVFDKTEQVWQLKWLPITRLALNRQLTSLACEVSHDVASQMASAWSKILCARRDLLHRANLVVLSPSLPAQKSFQHLTSLMWEHTMSSLIFSYCDNNGSWAGLKNKAGLFAWARLHKLWTVSFYKDSPLSVSHGWFPNGWGQQLLESNQRGAAVRPTFHLNRCFPLYLFLVTNCRATMSHLPTFWMLHCTQTPPVAHWKRILSVLSHAP